VGVVRRLGRQADPGVRLGQPGGRALLQLLGARADSHLDVNALDLGGLDLALYREAELAAAENVKRVVPPVKLSARDWLSDAKGQDPYWIAAFLEIKTVWHPIGV
jgi:hypothetical protein